MSASRSGTEARPPIIARDGIVFFRHRDRWKQSAVLAVPEARVRIVQRALRPTFSSVGTTFSDYIGVAALLLLYVVLGLQSVFDSLALAANAATGLTLATGITVGILRVRHLRRESRCSTRLVVETDRTTVPLTFKRIEGEDPELESLLDRLRAFRAFMLRTGPRGVIAVFHEPAMRRLKQWVFGFVALWLGLGWILQLTVLGLLASSGYESLLLLPGVAMLMHVLIGSSFDMMAPKTLRKACAALRAGDADTARPLLVRFLELNPRHVYANFLMCVCALMQGDIYTAAEHREAMHGDSPHFRVAEILFTLTHKVSSRATFWALAAYVQRRERGALPAFTPTDSSHEQPAH